MLAAGRARWNYDSLFCRHVLFHKAIIVVKGKLTVACLFIKADCNNLRNTAFFHSNTDCRACTHGCLPVVGNNDVLANVCKCPKSRNKRSYVLVVKGGVNLVQKTEWAGANLICCKQKGKGCHCLFSTGKQGNVLQLFSWRLCVNFYTCCKHVGRIHKA